MHREVNHAAVTPALGMRRVSNAEAALTQDSNVPMYKNDLVSYLWKAVEGENFWSLKMYTLGGESPIMARPRAGGEALG